MLFYVFFLSIVLFYVLFVCKCVMYYCYWVATQLQLKNISYRVIFDVQVAVSWFTRKDLPLVFKNKLRFLITKTRTFCKGQVFTSFCLYGLFCALDACSFLILENKVICLDAIRLITLCIERHQ